jgi:hypothetical protein
MVPQKIKIELRHNMTYVHTQQFFSVAYKDINKCVKGPK